MKCLLTLTAVITYVYINHYLSEANKGIYSKA